MPIHHWHDPILFHLFIYSFLFKYIESIYPFMSLLNDLQRLEINPRDIVNCHVHLPPLHGEALQAAKQSKGHAMLPPDVVQRTIPLVDIEGFHDDNAGLFGSAAILPVGAHNIHGKASVLYTPNEHVLQACKAHPDFYVPFASTDLRAKDAREKIEDLYSKGFAGIKYHALEGYAITDPGCRPTLEKMQELGMPVVMHTGDTPFPGTDLDHAHPREALRVANNYPDLRIMITHFATPYHLDAFAIASRYPNVYLDCAEFPVYWRAHPDNIYGPLLGPMNTRRIGIDKFVFGTDFPMPTFKWLGSRLETVIHSTREYLKAFVDLPGHYFTPAEKKAVLCENFWRFLGRTKAEVVRSNKRL